MSRIVYDAAILLGVLLIGVGVWQWSWPAALVTVGALIVVLTVLGAYLGRRP